jgi:hypothetical protein
MHDASELFQEFPSYSLKMTAVSLTNDSTLFGKPAFRLGNIIIMSVNTNFYPISCLWLTVAFRNFEIRKNCFAQARFTWTEFIESFFKNYSLVENFFKSVNHSGRAPLS